MGRKGARNASGRSRTDTDEGDEGDALFKLSFVQALRDPEVSAGLRRLISEATKDLQDTISALRTEVQSLHGALEDRDSKIATLQQQVCTLSEENDALEQYGRRRNVRIFGIRENDLIDTDQAVLSLAKDVLKMDPPLQPTDIDISHRLRSRRNPAPGEPRGIIVRFHNQKVRNRFIAARSMLKDPNRALTDQEFKTYINEDLTQKRSTLFAKVRKLQKDGHFEQTWTYNGTVRVKIRGTGKIESIDRLGDLDKYT